MTAGVEKDIQIVGDAETAMRSRALNAASYHLETAAENWAGSIACALRSPTLEAGIHHLAHSLRTLANVEYIEAVFSQDGTTFRVNCDCKSDTCRGRFTSQIMIADQATAECRNPPPSAYSILAEHVSSFEIALKLRLDWISSARECASSRPAALDAVLPLLHLAAERLCALAQNRFRTLSGNLVPRSLCVDLLYTRIGADLLSPRERQVLEMLISAHNPKMIARALGISPGTVRNHMRHIYTKLHVSSRPELLSRMIGAVLNSTAEGSLREGEHGSGRPEPWDVRPTCPPSAQDTAAIL